MKKVRIITLGCKVNQYESAAFISDFLKKGYVLASSEGQADIVIINSCAVTSSGARQSRQLIRKSLHENPNAEIVVTGCYAEIGADEIRCITKSGSRNLTIIGNSRKDYLIKSCTGELKDHENNSQFLFGNILAEKQITRLTIDSFYERTRAYLRIQDGCESYCSYCIVPYTRGPSRSLPPVEVLEQAKRFVKAGHREIVLTGIHIGKYGYDFSDKYQLFHLLDELTAQVPEAKYRISSLEPNEITEDILLLMRARDNIQPHLHIPLQSGNDTTLSKMNRGYTTAQFKDTIQLCRSYLPDAGIGIDILVGFPGETEQLFHTTTEFLTTLDFSYLHVFPYSKREGTDAAKLPDQVVKTTKNKWVKELRELSKKKKEKFYSKYCGYNLTVLIEKKRDSNGLLKGFTGNYIDVRLPGPDHLHNTLTKVQLQTYRDGYVLGERMINHEG